jgi:hypothetical protein
LTFCWMLGACWREFVEDILGICLKKLEGLRSHLENEVYVGAILCRCWYAILKTECNFDKDTCTLLERPESPSCSLLVSQTDVNHVGTSENDTKRTQAPERKQNNRQ